MTTLDGRERLLVAVAIHEWLEREGELPPLEQRRMDADDLLGVLQREFPDHYALIQELQPPPRDEAAAEC